MNITNFYPKFVVNQNNKKQSFASNSIIGLQKDTVSFTGGKSGKKLVEEFKTMDPNGHHNISKDDLIKVLRYFGHTEDCATRHRSAESFQGDKFVFAKDAIADPNFAAAVIRGVQMADEYDGALFLLKRNPSDEEKEKFKKQIAERPPYLDENNKYAQKLYEERQQKGEALLTVSEPDLNKKTQKLINENLARLKVLSAKIEGVAEIDVSSLNDTIATLEVMAREIASPSTVENIEALKRDTKKIETSINEAREFIAAVQRKLASGYGLNKQEEEKIAFLEQADFEINILKANSEAICETLGVEEDIKNESDKAKKNLISNIEDAYLKNIIAIEKNNAVIKEFEEFIAKLKTNSYCCTKKQIQTLENLLGQIVALNKQMMISLRKIDDEKIASLAECSHEEQMAIKCILLKNISSRFNESGTCPKEEIKKLSATFEKIKRKEFGFLNQEGQAKQNINTQSRIDAFNQKVEASKKLQTKLQEKPQEIVQTPVVPVEKKSSKESELTKKVDNVLKARKEKYNNFVNIFAQKISPLPLDVVKNEMLKIVLNAITREEIDAVQNSPEIYEELITRKVAEIKSSDETKRLTIAARFAYINSALNTDSSTPSIGKISQLISQHSQTGEVESLFNEYNKSLEELTDTIEGEDIFDSILETLLEFAPKDIENKVYAELETHGQYMVLLVDENISDIVKLELLKTFWEKFDSTYSTSYANEMLENFKTKQEEVNYIKMQEKKLEQINQFDWTI